MLWEALEKAGEGGFLILACTCLCITRLMGKGGMATVPSGRAAMPSPPVPPPGFRRPDRRRALVCMNVNGQRANAFGPPDCTKLYH